MLSPRELKKGAFSKSIKGYSVTEVDEYIHFLLSKYSEVYNNYVDLESKYQDVLNELSEAKSEENAISTTIVNAQKMADAIVRDAKEKAVGIKNAVSDSCDKILDEYMVKVAAEREKLARCEEAVNNFKSALINAYKKHLDLIYDIMPDEDPTPYLSDEELENKAVDMANEKIDDIVGNPAQVNDDESFDDSIAENVDETYEMMSEEQVELEDSAKEENV